ncbi:MAG: hypothetical protein HY644_00945 [Acidobacteria bacterium]|nr:hypothetical protein [Acidobacteriota bacterium]
MRLSRNVILFLWLSLAPWSLWAQSQQETRSQEIQAASSDEVLAKLQAAAIQHETIALLIEQQQFQSVIPELKKILDLTLPQEYELYEVQEIQSVVQELREKQQNSLGHAVVDLGLKYLQEDKSKSSLYLLKSQLYRDTRQIREALEVTELARKFYQSSLRPSRLQSQ